MRFRSGTVRSTANYAAGRFIPATLTLLATPVLARLLEPTAYGELTLALSVSAALSAGFFGWCEPISVRELSRNAGDGIDSAALTTFAQNTSSTFVMLSAIALVFALFAQWATGFPWLVLAVVTVLFGAASFLIGIARAEGKSGSFLLVSALANGGRSISGVIVALIGFTLASYFWGWAIFLVASITIGAISLNLRTFSRLAFRWPTRRFLVYILPVSGVALSTLLLQVIDRLTLDLVIDRASIGIYALGYALTETGVIVVFSILHSRLLPLLLISWANNREAAKRSLRMNGYIAAAIPLAMTPSLALFGADALAIVGGPEFRSASSWFMVAVAVGIAFYGVGQWLSVVLQYERLTFRWLFANGSGVIVNGISILILGPYIGILAGGIATIAAYACMTIMTLVLTREPDLWPIAWSSMALPLLGSISGVTTALALANLNAWIAAIIGTICYLAVVTIPRRHELKERLMALRAA